MKNSKFYLEFLLPSVLCNTAMLQRLSEKDEVPLNSIICSFILFRLKLQKVGMFLSLQIGRTALLLWLGSYLFFYSCTQLLPMFLMSLGLTVETNLGFGIGLATLLIPSMLLRLLLTLIFQLASSFCRSLLEVWFSVLQKTFQAAKPFISFPNT